MTRSSMWWKTTTSRFTLEHRLYKTAQVTVICGPVPTCYSMNQLTSELKSSVNGYFNINMSIQSDFRGGVVVAFDVEFANGARVRFLQPFVNALCVEEMETWHRPYLFLNCVLTQAHQA